MKASEISLGMMVVVIEPGRSTRVVGRGRVVQTYVKAGYGNRVDSTRVHLYDTEGKPRTETKWENGQQIDTGEPLVRTFRNGQLISQAEQDRRNEAERQKRIEQERRRNLVRGMNDNITQALVRAGLTENEISVHSMFVEAENDEPEGVTVRSIQIRGDSTTELMNFIYRELVLMEDGDE